MLRLSDPRNLGRLSLPAEVLQQLYAHLAPADWRQVHLVNKYLSRAMLQQRVQQTGRLGACVAALRKLLLQQQLLQQAVGRSTNRAEVHAKITASSAEEACTVWERLVNRGCASFLERVLPARASLTVVLAGRQCGHAGGRHAAGELATLQLQGTAELA
ncbi:hypothetical protein OEZ85_010533 [Tetradesmus obliquus]|uniref:F-box domain-containing protein n=1 Tax=Tetradesmus obliquus TaxID=3088 RepID=A0ABY8TPW3_TETOB|nr:hypothetical protein OEZ85_010533 [Tetradesmus obliquus]